MSAFPPRHTFTFPLLGLSLLLGWAVAAPLLTPKAKPLPQDPSLQVYTNHNPAQTYRDRDRSVTRPGDDLEQIILKEIRQATRSIDIAVQEIRLPKIAQALRNKHNKGVQVRLILENNYSRPYSDYSESEIKTLDEREQKRIRDSHLLIDRDRNGELSPKEIAERDALVILNNAGIPRIDDTEDGSKGTGLMHHKFLVIDRQRVIVTTANLTRSDIHGDLAVAQSRGNPNSLLNINSPTLAALYTEEFNYMWGDGPGGVSDSRFGLNKPPRAMKTVAIGTHKVEVQFSPVSAKHTPWHQSTNGLIAKQLKQSKTSVDFALFVFSDQGIADALAARRSQIKIRGLVDASFIFRPYSEALDLMGLNLGGDCTTGNNPWTMPLKTIGYPELPQGDLLHHKFAVIDRQTVIVGSHNWTNAANHTNDESLLVIDHPTVAAHYQREFDRLYPSAQLGPTATIKAQAQSPPTCPLGKPGRKMRSREAVEL